MVATKVDHTGPKYNHSRSPRKDRDKVALSITDTTGRYSQRYAAVSLRRISRLMTYTRMRLKAYLAYNRLTTYLDSDRQYGRTHMAIHDSYNISESAFPQNARY